MIDLDVLHLWALFFCSSITAGLSIGGLYGISYQPNPRFKAGLFLSSMASLGGVAFALLFESFLPLLASFAINHGLRWIGLDPDKPK
jgi:hypothetical protein